MTATAANTDMAKYLSELNPVFDQPADAAVFFCHCLLLQDRFVPCGEGGAPLPSRLPDHWNSKPDCYTFQYRHPDSSLTFLVKVVPLATRAVVLATAVEDPSSYCHCELDVQSFFAADDADYVTCFRNKEGAERHFKQAVSHKLVPVDGVTTGFTPTAEDQRRDHPPYRPRGDPMGYDDPAGGPPGPRFGIGGSDRDPFRPGGAGPGPWFGGEGGGNVIGPRHPGFGGHFGFPGAGGGGGGGGLPFDPDFHPPPPGARFDPFGPPDVDSRGMGPGPLGPGRGRGRGRGGGGAFFGEPDADHTPFGSDHMFM